MSKFDIPVHELTRRPGHTSSLQLAIDLDDAMGQGAASVPAGAKIEVDLRLESIHEGVLATGEVFTFTHLPDSHLSFQIIAISLENSVQSNF